MNWICLALMVLTMWMIRKWMNMIEAELRIQKKLIDALLGRDV